MSKILHIHSCFECPWFIKQLYIFKYPASRDTALFWCGHPSNDKRIPSSQLLLHECYHDCPLGDVYE